MKRKNKFWSFKKARAYVRKLGLKSEPEWRKYCKSGRKNKNIPWSSDFYYKNKGWKSWGDFLGTGRINYKDIKWLSYKKARNKIRFDIKKFKIDSQQKWYLYCRSGYKPYNVPVAPHAMYKDKGWKNWTHWLRSENRIFVRRYNVNDDFFKNWSHDMAYILGFWFADGNIYKKRFSICQHKKDKYILTEMLKKMQSNNPLYSLKNCYVFSIISKAIINDVIRLGGKPNKSLDIKFPKVPPKYLPDFVRGLWDGDGSIHYDKKNKRYISSFVSGSKKFIYGFYKVLKSNIFGLKGCIFNEVRDKFICYRLHFSSNDSIRLRDFMYSSSDNLRLKRKYNKFVLVKKKKDFLSFKDARKIVRKLNLGSRKDWYNYKVSNKLFNIPYSPEEAYKNSGWIDWYDWLGKERYFLSFRKAIRIVRQLHFKNILQYNQWLRDNPLNNIPSAPFMVYKKEWIDWYDWLDKKRPLDKIKLLKEKA